MKQEVIYGLEESFFKLSIPIQRKAQRGKQEHKEKGGGGEEARFPLKSRVKGPSEKGRRKEKRSVPKRSPNKNAKPISPDWNEEESGTCCKYSRVLLFFVSRCRTYFSIQWILTEAKYVQYST